MALTRRQQQVMDFLLEFLNKHHYSPSYEEIANGLDLNSLATVHKHIQALEKKGYLRRGFNQSRSLEVAEHYLKEQEMHAQARGATLELPLMGRIAAGTPVESVPGQETLNFSDFLKSEDTYALQVRGDSMIEDHICSGDFVLVERTQQIKDGDIVVALVKGLETTLKRFYKQSGAVARLQPANSEMEPILVPLADLEIQGRVLAVLRKYK